MRLLFFILLSVFFQNAFSASAQMVYKGSGTGLYGSTCGDELAHFNIGKPEAYVSAGEEQYNNWTVICYGQKPSTSIISTIASLSLYGTCDNQTYQRLNSDSLIANASADDYCPDNPNCPSSGLAQEGWVSGSVTSSGIGCVNQCEALSSPDLPSYECAFNADGVGQCEYWTWVKYYYTGNNCNGDPPQFENKPDNGNCPECDCMADGQGYGTVNGTVVCTQLGSPNSSNAEGSKVPSSDEQAPEGSTDQLQSNGSVSSFDENGNEASNQTYDDFCSNNPQSEICTNKDKNFGGSCDSTFTCNGDVIQCAIAQEQHKRNCELFENQTELSDLGNAMVEGNDPLDLPSPNEAESLTPNVNIDTTNPYGSGGLTDMTVGLNGSTITIPFSALNQALSLAGGIVIFGSMLFAYGIIRKAVLEL